MLGELPVRTRGACCALEVTLEPDRIATAVEVMKALADPTRLGIMAALRAQSAPVCICDLVEVFDLTQPTLSHHMSILKGAGLVAAEKRGIWIFYSLRPDIPSGVRKVLEAVADV